MSRAALIAIIRAAHTRPRQPVTAYHGHYVIGANTRQEAICLYWGNDSPGQVDAVILRAIFREARQLGLRGKIHVHAATSLVAETPTFCFYQEG